MAKKIDYVALGKFLKEARESAGWNQQQLAHQLMVSKQAISNWEKGEPTSLDRYLEVGTWLKVDVLGFLTGQALPEQIENVKFKSLRGRVIARMTFEQAKSMNDMTIFTDHVRSSFPCSTESFALILDDNSNAPEYLAGDSVIIDRQLERKPRDMVFALYGRERTPVFRRFVTVGSYPEIRFRLEPIADGWPAYELTSDEAEQFIVGVMSEHTRPRR